MAVTSSSLRDDVLAYARDVARLAAQDTARRIVSDPATPRDTGKMAGATRAAGGVRTTGTAAVARIENPTMEAEWTDKGTQPHVIVPRRRGGVLVFHWPKAGGVVFLRRVHHPGSRKHVGWFDKVAARHWPDACRRAVAALGTR